MSKRDFHFNAEKNAPIKSGQINKTKPKNPAPPINAKRNPSVNAQEYSVYDDIANRRKGKTPQTVDLSYGEYINVDKHDKPDRKNKSQKQKITPDNEIFSDSEYMNNECNFSNGGADFKEWIILIVFLFVLCLGVLAVYLYFNF